MPKISIITDTDSSLPAALADYWEIEQVPISIHFGEESYTTGRDIDDTRLFELIDSKQKLPTTAAPSPSMFEKAFQKAFDKGADEIVCITVSGKISATYNSALKASEFFEDRIIHVFDSNNLCMGQGFMVLEAARAAKDQKSSAEILALLETFNDRLVVFATLPTLKYLAMSGRVGKLAANMANTLNIKPILSVQDGKLDLLEKVRTQKKAILRMLELNREKINGRPVEKIAIIHINNPDGAEGLRNTIQEEYPAVSEIILAEFTPGLSVHAGSGVLGVVCLAAEN